jgi:hypothetical protein
MDCFAQYTRYLKANNLQPNPLKSYLHKKKIGASKQFFSDLESKESKK